VCPILLPDKLTDNLYRDFSGNCSTGASWSCAFSCDAESVISSQRSSSALWGRYPTVVETDISRKVYSKSRANCMSSSVFGSNSHEFPPVETPEGAGLCSPSQNYRRSRGKTSSSCDNDQWQ
jgi:hypothetical protein